MRSAAAGPSTSATATARFERDDRRRRHREQLIVERDDLAPVGGAGRRRVGVHRVDRRLDLVRPGTIAAQAVADDALALGDQRPIPRAAVLIAQPDEQTVGIDAGGAAGVDQQHQRQQAEDLLFVGQERGQHTPEPDRLGAQIVADQTLAARCRVAFVEDQVDDGQHRAQTLWQLALFRHAVGDAGVADLGLGADDPLRHRRLGHQEGARDLRRREAAEQPQRQRHLRARRERRVTAGEDQAQPIVVHGVVLPTGGLDRLVAGMEQGRLRVPVGARRLAAEAIDGAVAGGGDDPPRRAGRQPRLRPARGRRRERVLDGVLGHADVAEDAGQHGHRAAVLLAEHPFDVPRGRWIGAAAPRPPARRSLTDRAPRASAAPRPPAG